jgi:hypothetical protein
MICCTEPGLTAALYILHIHTFNNMQNVNILYILKTDLLLHNVTLINDRSVLSSERAPYMDRTVTVKEELISGHEPQSQCDFHFDIEQNRTVVVESSRVSGRQPAGI